MKKCPRCGGEARRSHKHGFLQTTILRRVGIRPYRCRDCGARFYRFSTNGADGNGSQKVTSQIFEQPEKKNGHFKELIAQISQKERELGLGKQEHGMADELRRLRERAAAEGLTADKTKTSS